MTTPRIEELFGTKCDTYEENCHTCEVYRAIDEAHQAGIDEAVGIVKNVILRRTEIPKGARNPTRDAIVILGEQLCELIDDTIKTLQDKK